ncbi:MAG: class I SAM-dependent methyltransferase [Vicinamibacterales bacterium]
MTKHFMALAIVSFGLTAAPALAQLGGRPAEDWIARLERPERVATLKTSEVIEKLGLKKGDSVADVGAGAGVFSWPLARAIAPATLYAVEVDKAFITHLESRKKEQGITNVTTVLGAFDDPKLPEPVDLAFFHDVLHHVDHRDAYLKKVASYLKPNGRIAIIELDADKPEASHRDDPKLQVRRPDVQAWMEAAGLHKLEEYQLFEDKWFVVYGKGAQQH